MNNKQFTAIDFETANEKMYSACSLGLIVIKKERVIHSKHYLIKPPDNHYNNLNIRIHGISPIETENSPIFSEIWPEILPFIENQLVVAHNMNFDKQILIQTLKYYNIDIPNFQTDCTYRKFGRKLDECCFYYDISLDHHYAYSDALACAQLYLKYIKNEKPSNIKIQEGYKSRNKLFDYHERINRDLLIPDFESADINNPFYKKKVVITGVFDNFSRQELALCLKNLGADINTSLSSKTDYLIAGHECGPSKYKKAIQLNIPIILETELIEMTNLK